MALERNRLAVVEAVLAHHAQQDAAARAPFRSSARAVARLVAMGFCTCTCLPALRADLEGLQAEIREGADVHVVHVADGGKPPRSWPRTRAPCCAGEAAARPPRGCRCRPSTRSRCSGRPARACARSRPVPIIPTLIDDLPQTILPKREHRTPDSRVPLQWGLRMKRHFGVFAAVLAVLTAACRLARSAAGRRGGRGERPRHHLRRAREDLSDAVRSPTRGQSNEDQVMAQKLDLLNA